MDEATDLFFKPRVVEVQGRLDFLTIPPARIIAFPTEASDFVGINLHWIGATSALCLGEETCIYHKNGSPSRPYFYTGAYLWCFSTRSWKRFILPIGGEVSQYADEKLVGKVWKVEGKVNEWNKKKGLALVKQSTPADQKPVLEALKPFDICPRILQRYKVG